MVIRRTPPRHPRRGPSCLFVLFVAAVFSVGAYVIANADEVRESLTPNPTPEPTRSAASLATSASLFERDGDYEAAIEAYEAAVRSDGSRVDYYIPLIKLLTHLKRPEDALDWAEQATILDPANDAVWTVQAAAHLANGDRLANEGDPTGAALQYQEAVNAARQAVEINPDNAEAYAYGGGAEVQLGPEHLVRAQEMIETALNLAPDSPIAHRYYASLLESQGFYTDAIEQYLIALDQEPSADLYINLARNYWANRDIPQAILYFEEAINQEPENAEAYDGLGYMYFLIGEYPTAQQNFEKAVQYAPEMVRAHAHLGAALFRQNSYDEAIKELEQATAGYDAITPDNAIYFNMLGLAYYYTTSECSKARPIFEQVLLVSEPESLARLNATEGLDLCHQAELNNP